MADVALKHVVPSPGAAVRERLHAMDDSALVAAFLAGEERAFQEVVERYQTRLLNFMYRTIGDREQGGGPRAGGVHPRVPAHAPVRSVEEVLDVDLHDRVEPGEERAAQPVAQSARALPDDQENWEDEDRPLQFEDTTTRPDDMYRKRHLRELVEASVARAAGASSPGVRACASSRGSRTRRSPRSPTATSER